MNTYDIEWLVHFERQLDLGDTAALVRWSRAEIKVMNWLMTF